MKSEALKNLIELVRTDSFEGPPYLPGFCEEAKDLRASGLEGVACTMKAAYFGDATAAFEFAEMTIPNADVSVGRGPVQATSGCAHIVIWQVGEWTEEAETPGRAIVLATLQALLAQQEEDTVPA